MKNVKINTEIVDGETRVQAYVNGTFVEEVETNSQFSVAEAKEYLKSKHLA